MSDSDSKNDAWHIPPSRYVYEREGDFQMPRKPVSIYVPMRDGCRLALDYYLPSSPQSTAQTNVKFPVILIFTPYYRRFALKRKDIGTDPSPNSGKYRDYFVTRGYVLVVVDVRGTGASFGTRDSFRSPRERDDYQQIAEWVTGQSWCNGSIGATGISYLGAACDFLASTGHSAVKAIAPISSVWDTYLDNYYPGGLFLNQLAQTYDKLMMALDRDRRDLLHEFDYFKNPNFAGPMPVDDDADGHSCQAAIREHLGNFRMPDFIREFTYHDDTLPYDETFTSASFSPCHYRENIPRSVAILSISGWMDGAGYANGSISRFLTLKESNTSYLLLGPWDHGARINVSPWRRNAIPQFNLFDEILRFFDHHLSNRDTGLQHEKPVHYFSIHEESWHASETWPPLRETTALYLTPNQGLGKSPQYSDTFDEVDVDYSFGTGKNTRYERISGRDCRSYYPDWGHREKHLLGFTSEPLPADTELTGHVVADLWISFSQPDAAIHLYLSEILDNGKSHYVTEGMLRALHRQEALPSVTYCTSWPSQTFSRKDASPLPLNTPINIRFALLPVSWMFSRGSRIRLSLAGTDSDHVIQVPHGAPPHLCIWHGTHNQFSTLKLPLRFKLGNIKS